MKFLFTFCHKGGVFCISEVIDISPGNLDSSLCFIQSRISHDVVYFCFIDNAKAFVWITTNCGKFLKRWEYQTTWPPSWEICMRVKKQHLELDMEQQTGSRLGKEYVKAVYCHLAYLKPSLENFEHCFASMWNECSCAVVRIFFVIALLWIGMKTDSGLISKIYR